MASGTGRIKLIEEKQAKEQMKSIFVEASHACNIEENPEACHQLGVYYHAVEKKATEAWKVFYDNCMKRDFAESCLTAGNALLTGNGCPRDHDKALQVFSKACDNENFGACNNAGLVHQDRGEMEEAMTAFQKACSGKFRNGCFNLSVVHLKGIRGVPVDMEKALEYAVKSCDLGHAWGCGNASRMYKLGDGVEKNSELADAFLKKAKNLMIHTLT